MERVTFFFSPTVDDFGGDALAMDLRITHPDATLADLLSAEDTFAAAHLADCKGCDGCCQERAPLIAADIPALCSLLSAPPFPVHAVCEAFAEIYVEDGICDIAFRRDAWQERAFVCRSHFCLPRSAVFSQLREEIVNMGENELTRLLLAEEANGALPLTPVSLKELVDPTDYPENPMSGKTSYDQIRLADVLSPALWAELTAPLPEEIV